jgi:hypothetical protein
MGANAQTSVPTFTAGEILTAANMNISARTGIPVFADSTARDAAFGGTGEKTLAEGQFAYLEDTNATQYYDGSTWQAVGQDTNGLVRVGGATFTSQTSVAFANSTFTTTYEQYMVVLVCKTATAANSTLTLRVRDNSGSKSGANYYGGWVGRDATGTLASLNTNGGTSYSLGIANNLHGLGLTMTVYDPAAVSETIFSYHSEIRSDGTRITAGGAGGGVYDQQEAITGLEFLFSVAASGSYQVYGLAMS